MDERERVGVILNRMNPTLRKYLNLDEEFCVELKATVPQVISNDEHQEIQAISVTSERIDRLVDLMKRKSINVFLEFMRVLREKDYDLYKNVEAFQNDDRTDEKDSRAENDVLSVATTHDTKCDTHCFITARFYCGTCHKPVCSECIKQNPNVHDHDDDMIQETHNTSVAAAMSLDETLGSSSKPEINRDLKNGAAAANPLQYAEERAFSKTNVNTLTKPMAAVRPLKNTPIGWKQTGQFSTDSSADTKGFYPSGIPIRPNGDVVVVGISMRLLYCERICKVFSRDGLPGNYFRVPLNNIPYSKRLDQMDFARDFAITQDNRYIFSGLNSIIVCDNQGIRDIFSTYDFKLKLLRMLATTIPSVYGVDFKTPNTLAVDSKGLIIAGLMSNTISIYNGDGCLRSKFYTSAPPNSLDITSKGAIAVTFYDNSLQVMDYSGNNVRVMERPQDVDQWLPSTVCCSKQDEIFVLNRGNNSVYRYTADGEQCLGCIIPGLDNPRGIAITEDGHQLYVVEHMQNMMKIFQRQ